jgi:alpha-glucosidase (family GH31 glycosyl hydrolase)
MHVPGSKQPLYGSIPFVQGIADDRTSATLWVNSANTFIEIRTGKDGGRHVSYVSESGALEVFLIASTSDGIS